MKELFFQLIIRWGRSCMLIALTCVLIPFNDAPAEASGVPFHTGDVIVGVGGIWINHFNANGSFLDTINIQECVANTYGIGQMSFDAAGNLYVPVWTTKSNAGYGPPGTVLKFDSSGNCIGTVGTPDSGTPGSGYLRPVSIAFSLDGTGYIADFSGPQSHRGYVWAFPGGSYSSVETDFWIDYLDLAPDQCTVHYTNGETGVYTPGGAVVKRFNVCTGTQLSDFPIGSTTETCGLGIRVRSNFETLVACDVHIYRFDGQGNKLRTYQPQFSNVGAIALDPDDQTFWSGDSNGARITRINIATGAQIIQFIGTVGSQNSAVSGLVIVPGEPQAVTDLGPCDDCNASVGHPINVTNGNTYIEAQDYSLPGLGGGISLHRTWNSRWPSISPITQAGLFGDSWRSTYEERLQLVDTTHLNYWRGDGSVWSFLSVSGVWKLQSPADQYVTLAYNSSTAQYTLTYRDGSQKVFTQLGYVIAIKDRNGNTTSVTYDTSNRIVQVTDAAGRSLTLSYGNANNPNQVTSIADAVGVVATYSYDATSHLLQVQYADSTINSYVYDASGLITSVLDNEGKLLEAHTYDAQRRGLSSQRANGVDLVTVSYGINSGARITNSASNTSNFAYTKIAGRGKVTFVSGSTCASCGAQGGGTYTFDTRANRTSSADALGNVTRFTYDSFDDVLTRSIQVNGSDVTWTYTYNSLGEILTASDPLGFTTTNTYDAKGNLLTTTTPSPGGHTSGSTTSFTYDTKGQLLTVTDPLNHVTRFTYTPAGLIESITDALSKVTRFEYDGRGNRTAVVDALNQRTTFAYDSRNRLTSITYPTTPATSTSFTYDSRGRRLSVTDPNQKTTTYTYDDADRLISATDAQTPAGVTRYDYDSENNLIRLTDALGRFTQFEYTADRRVTRTTFPSTLFETYTYDAVGSLTTKTDRKNQTIRYTYDPLRRLTSKQYPDFTQVQYTYDAASRLTRITDPTGTDQFTYDNMARLTETSTVYAFISGKTFTVDYAWDAASNLTSMTDPQRGDNTYTYDALNRLATLKNPQRNQFSFTYDALGRRMQLMRPNSVNTNYQYDSLSRVTSLLHQFTTKQGATTLDGAEYSYDAAGNRLSRTDKFTNIVSNYAYDPLYELTGVTQGGNTVESYSFDAVSNRLSSLSVPSYTYNVSNQLTNQPGVTYTYDNNGNLASKVDGTGTTTYFWDFEDRLTQITLPGNSQVNFKYDPMGRRIQKSSSSGTVNYLYDRVNILEEVDAAGTLVTRYTQGENIDEPLSILKSGTTSYFEADGLGSITSLTNSSGGLVGTYSYDSFGKLTLSTGTISHPYRFTGRELDTETGLMYYRARYYNPAIGRFNSEDPLGFGGGDVNLYAYIGNDPINLIDPSGLTWTSNWNYFWDWARGRGPRTRNYGPNDLETQELMNSPGINNLRDAFNRGGCKSQNHLSYDTFKAYWDTVANPLTADWSNTAAEVGGFGGASIVNNGNGTATFTIPNTSGTHSFFLHLVPDRKSPTTDMSNIYQTFQWTEPLSGRNCGCQH